MAKQLLGIDSSVKHLGSGSLYIPTNQYNDNKVIIAPAQGQDFSIATNEDFIISMWANVSQFPLGTQNGVKYPIMSYAGGQIQQGSPETYNNSEGWEFGLVAYPRLGFLPYFSYNGNIMSTVYDPSNATGSTYQAGFARWQATRTNGVIKFEYYNPNGTSINVNTHTTTESIAVRIPNNTYYGDYSGVKLGTDIPVFGSNDADGVWVDEIFFARGVSSVFQTNPVDPNVLPGDPPEDLWQLYGEIADGGLSTTVFLYHFNGNYYDDQMGIKNAIASLTSTASVSAIAKSIANASAQLTVSSTFTLAPDAIEHSATTLHATTQLTAQAIKTGHATAHLASTTTANATANPIRTTSVNILALSSEVILGGLDKQTSVALESTSSLTATATVTRIVDSGIINLEVTSSVTAQVIRSISIQSTLHTTSSINSFVVKTANASSHLHLTSEMFIGQMVDSGVIAIHSAFTLNSIIYESVIDTTIIWYVQPENKTWMIEQEITTWTIEQEERDYIVLIEI